MNSGRGDVEAIEAAGTGGKRGKSEGVTQRGNAT